MNGTYQVKILPALNALIPPLTHEEFYQLEYNCLSEGIRDKLIVAVFPDEETGEVVEFLADGHNRLNIAEKHNLKYEISKREFDGLSDVKIWMIDTQKGRRNLTDGWKFELARVRADVLKEKGREKQRKAGKAYGEGHKKEELLSIIDKSSELDSAHNTQKEVAKSLGWSTGKVAMAEKVWKEANSEIKEKVLSGDMTISGAYKEVKKAKIEHRRRQIRETLQEEEMATGQKRYRVIYADPPWKYGNAMPEYVTEPQDYYLLMDTEDICLMPIKDISEDNSVLFLWSTSPHLPEALQVADAWGFKYKTSFVWDKIKHNMGHYNSVRHEFLLVCTRGACTPDVKRLFDSVVSIERTEHSKKPERFREIIDTLYTHGNKIELFARCAAPGWDVFGNQVKEAANV